MGAFYRKIGTMRAATLLVLLLALTACQTTYNTQIASLSRAAGTTRIALMPVDVQLSELTAFAGAQPRAEWTDAAKQHLAAALKAENAAQGLALAEYDAAAAADLDADKLDQISKLHGAVGQTILLQQLGAMPLPTRQDRFDWTLGPETKVLKSASGADYALFVYVRDSYTSAGRAAVQVVGALLGVGVPGGQQLGFASLVDLETGNVVWFNRVLRNTGDLRNADSARETARTLLAGLPR
jgi:hypothetical protein